MQLNDTSLDLIAKKIERSKGYVYAMIIIIIYNCNNSFSCSIKGLGVLCQQSEYCVFFSKFNATVCDAWLLTNCLVKSQRFLWKAFENTELCSRHYMAKVLSIRCKTLNNQSINQLIISCQVISRCPFWCKDPRKERALFFPRYHSKDLELSSIEKTLMSFISGNRSF